MKDIFLSIIIAAGIYIVAIVAAGLAAFLVHPTQSPTPNQERELQEIIRKQEELIDNQNKMIDIYELILNQQDSNVTA